ncbi:hypothetical protein LTR08_009161 [Meristemomyces frigidus]|nr:hypothetical protein LTR08_009161 [Meristemomyces frigidus]
MSNSNPGPSSFRGFFKDIFQNEPLLNEDQSFSTTNVHLLGMPNDCIDLTDADISTAQPFALGGLDDVEAWFDTDLASLWNGSVSGQPTGTGGRDLHSSMAKGSEAFKRSTWTWTPSDEKGAHDQINLAACPEQGPPQSDHHHTLPLLTERLDQRTRGRVIGMLMTICDEVNYSDIVSSFPGSVMLSSLVNDFLLASEGNASDFIHVASFRPSKSKPELISAIIASGAVVSPLSGIQRFGYALQETTRLCLPKMFEKDNRLIRNLQSLQAFALCLDVGLWSGDRRVTEISESIFFPLVTMLRRGNHFRASSVSLSTPLYDDDDTNLEQKWQQWVEAESVKRLVYKVWTHTSQVSMALQTPPLVSYAEIVLELPAPQSLWRARSARQWRDHYLAVEGLCKIPTFIQCIFDLEKLTSVRDKIDLDLSLYLILLAHWGLVWEYRQLQAAIQAQPLQTSWNAASLAPSRGQDIRVMMKRCQTIVNDWGLVDHRRRITAELVRMNLYVSMQDLHLLAGKEGVQEARSTLPLLKKWQRTSNARRAIWHAGQVLCATKHANFGNGGSNGLRDFNVTSVYHASLTLWVYGVLARIESSNLNDALPGDTVFLDGDPETDGAKRDRFFDLGKGSPALSIQLGETMTTPDSNTQPTDASGSQGLVHLTQPNQVMALIVRLVDAACNTLVVGPRSQTRRPNLVENLIQLMLDLGNAAAEETDNLVCYYS